MAIERNDGELWKIKVHALFCGAGGQLLIGLMEGRLICAGSSDFRRKAECLQS